MITPRTLTQVSGWPGLGSIFGIIMPLLTHTAHALPTPDAPKIGRAGIAMSLTPVTRPYLTVVTLNALRVVAPVSRYKPEPPPPAPSAKPVAPEPVAVAPKDPHPVPQNPPPAVPEETPPVAEPVDNSGKKPVSILPDDTRREIREEDVLPYFQVPRGRSVFAPGMPSEPQALPESSATYRQQ